MVHFSSPAALSRRFFFSSFAAAAAFPGLAQTQPRLLYNAEDLGWLSGYDGFRPVAINQLGQVTGNAGNVARLANEGFLWTPDGTSGPPENPRMRTLGNLAGVPPWIFNGSLAGGLNSNGDVVGTADGTDQLVDVEHATLWHASGVKLDLGTLTDTGMNSMATGINNVGRIVGWSDTRFGTLDWFKFRHAFVYNLAAGRMYDLGVDHSEANGINDWNEIVGAWYPEETRTHAVYWEPSGAGYDLHDWVTAGGSWSKAAAINDGGQIVGWAADPNDRTHRGFVANLQTGVVRHLPDLSTEHESRLYSINSRGQAVGLFKANLFSYHALLFDANTGAAENLNDCLPADQRWPNVPQPHRLSGWLLKEAWGINNLGQIAGCGTHSIEGRYIDRAFRLLPRSD